MVQVTHPRILFLLAFLVSSTAKRDAVGRKPKRKVFANEGLAAFDKKNVPPPLIRMYCFPRFLLFKLILYVQSRYGPAQET